MPPTVEAFSCGGNSLGISIGATALMGMNIRAATLGVVAIWTTAVLHAEPTFLEKLKKEAITTQYHLLMGRADLLDAEIEAHLSSVWQMNHTPVMLETLGLASDRNYVLTVRRILAEKTGIVSEGGDEPWRQWLWAREYKQLADYEAFKSGLYRQIDPRFAEYFSADRESTIRLDEVRWGGVKQDGIPPLRDPEMIQAGEADYLGSGDIVFGIEVNGDFRAYPKRILAWHEMFTDTIQGVSLAGVY